MIIRWQRALTAYGKAGGKLINGFISLIRLSEKTSRGEGRRSETRQQHDLIIWRIA